MRAILQRTREARVEIEGLVIGQIEKGFLILLGIEENDKTEDAEWLIEKICNIRVFSDVEGKMNRDVRQEDGAFLVVSQFTLYASTKKGNRPSFVRAARPEKALPLYNYFITVLADTSGLPVASGKFGAMMDVHLLNDGPVTIILDSKAKE
ncbi:MAG: D-tyrosyl-tRNA(Tyr) deacylase [Crocinitomicaceae bacterium]|nr:D-tyrosyl-tRNA(Tyr) deacylase [Crocinitomicaceae bacterium]